MTTMTTETTISTNNNEIPRRKEDVDRNNNNNNIINEKLLPECEPIPKENDESDNNSTKMMLSSSSPIGGGGSSAASSCRRSPLIRDTNKVTGTSLFADSPYYDALVHKELITLEIAYDTIKDINNKLNEYTKYGHLMANATKQLSLSCQLLQQQQNKVYNNNNKSSNNNDNIDDNEKKDQQKQSKNNEEVDKIKQALGHRLSNILQRFGVVLEEMANAQVDMFTSIEKALRNDVVDSAMSEIRIAKQLKDDSINETEKAAQVLAKYLDDVKPTTGRSSNNASASSLQNNNSSRKGISKEEPTQSRRTSMAGSGMGRRDIRRSRSLSHDGSSPAIQHIRRGRRRNTATTGTPPGGGGGGGSEGGGSSTAVSLTEMRSVATRASKSGKKGSGSSSSTVVVAKPMEIRAVVRMNSKDPPKRQSSWGLVRSSLGRPALDPIKAIAIEMAQRKCNMKQICLEQTSATLKRFQLAKHFMEARYERDYELSKSTVHIVSKLCNHYKDCTILFDKLLPKITKLETSCSKRYFANKDNDKYHWREKGNKIVKTLTQMEKAVDGAQMELTAASSSNSGSSISIDSLNIEKVEKDTMLWDIPNFLALLTEARRIHPPGVQIEGWLYTKKQSSLISSESWIRQWYILSKGALYSLQQGSSNTSSTSISGSSSGGGGGGITGSGSGSSSDGIINTMMIPNISKTKICDVVLSTVRECIDCKENRFVFELIIPNSKDPITLRTSGPQEYKKWVDGIRFAIEKEFIRGIDISTVGSLSNSKSNSNSSTRLNQNIGKKYERRSSEIIHTISNQSSSMIFADFENETNHSDSDNSDDSSNSSSSSDYDNSNNNNNNTSSSNNNNNNNTSSSSSSEDYNNSNRNKINTTANKNNNNNNMMIDQYHSISSSKENKNVPVEEESVSLVQQMMDANPKCVDCGQISPDWVSLNLGILMCINCSGAHRFLGVHVSKVRSLCLDTLSNHEANLVLSLGNEYANNMYEKELHEIQSTTTTKEGVNNVVDVDDDEIPSKPTSESDKDSREWYIECKYVSKIFLGRDDELDDDYDDENENENDDNDNQNGVVVFSEKASQYLYNAVIIGNVRMASRALAHDANVNWKNINENNQTPLEACLIALKKYNNNNNNEKTQYNINNNCN